LKLSSLSKVIYPDIGLLKAEVIQYYLKYADLVLRYTKHRPLSIIRYPDGIMKDHFYSKDKPEWAPDWIDSIKINHKESSVDYLELRKPSQLIWIANLSGLELHPMSYEIENNQKPDYFVFDLDPGIEVLFDQTKFIAAELRDFLLDFGYAPFIKTSGGKGLHIYVPIISNYAYNEVYQHVHSLAKKFISAHSKLCTLKLSKKNRDDKMLVDIYRNRFTSTTVAPYSLRGKAGAPISTPIVWEQLNEIDSSQHFNIKNIEGQIEKFGDAWSEWRSFATDLKNNIESKQHPISEVESPSIPAISESELPVKLDFVEPMLATATRQLPNGDDWVYEVKWDGIRVIIIRDENGVRLYSRAGNNISSKFPQIASAFMKWNKYFILDGEIVVLDDAGKPKFEEVLSRLNKSNKDGKIKSSTKAATCYLFDIMYANGQSVTDHTWSDRRALLKKMSVDHTQIRLSESVSDGPSLLQAIRQKGMEGVIAKRTSSPYFIGERRDSWLKLKCRYMATSLIIGFTQGKGNRAGTFGALHLAERVEERLVYRGKVGTGFDFQQRKSIKKMLVNLVTTNKPVDTRVDQERLSTWVEPSLNCQIQYATMTSNETFREPVFIRLLK